MFCREMIHSYFQKGNTGVVLLETWEGGGEGGDNHFQLSYCTVMIITIKNFYICMESSGKG